MNKNTPNKIDFDPVNCSVNKTDFKKPNWLNKVMEKLKIPQLKINQIGIVKQY